MGGVMIKFLPRKKKMQQMSECKTQILLQRQSIIYPLNLQTINTMACLNKHKIQLRNARNMLQQSRAAVDQPVAGFSSVEPNI